MNCLGLEMHIVSEAPSFPSLSRPSPQKGCTCFPFICGNCHVCLLAPSALWMPTKLPLTLIQSSQEWGTLISDWASEKVGPQKAPQWSPINNTLGFSPASGFWGWLTSASEMEQDFSSSWVSNDCAICFSFSFLWQTIHSSLLCFSALSCYQKVEINFAKSKTVERDWWIKFKVAVLIHLHLPLPCPG